MKYDVIIIGSGLGGLVCASVLSRSGRSVLLLERETQAGGCIQSYKRRGMRFDTGFHYVGGLGEGQSLYAAFDYLGLLRLPWQRLDEAFDRVTIADRTFAFMQGYDAFVDALAAEFPAERKGLEQYARLLRYTGEHQFDALNPSAPESSDFPDLVETSAYGYLERTFNDSLLINVLSGTSLKMELRRESLPLFTFAHGNGSFIESSWRLKGDGSLIVDSLLNDIRSRGGNIVYNAEVTELVEQGGKLRCAVCADGERYEGDTFISDVHPAVTCGWVKQSERMKKVYRNRIARLENTFGMFTVSLALKPQSVRYFNCNRYVYRRPDVWTFYQADAPVSGILISCRVPDDGSEYTRQLDLLTPMPWSRCTPWIDTTVGRRGEAYRQMKEQMADECMTLAERILPGLSRHVEARYTSTPLTYRDYTFTPEGSAYGLRKDFNSPMLTMLSPRTPIPNLLLTGQNLMLHGLHGVTMTALFTCAEVMGKDKIWNIVNTNQ